MTESVIKRGNVVGVSLGEALHLWALLSWQRTIGLICVLGGQGCPVQSPGSSGRSSLEHADTDVSVEALKLLLDTDPNFFGLFTRCVLEDKSFGPERRQQAARSLLEVAFGGPGLIHHCLLAVAFVGLKTGIPRSQGQWLTMALATSTAHQQFRNSGEVVAFVRIVLRSPDIAPKDRALLVGLLLSDEAVAPLWGPVLLRTVLESGRVERRSCATCAVVSSRTASRWRPPSGAGAAVAEGAGR